MINNVNRTFTTTPLLVISGHLLNIFVLVDILAEGEGNEPAHSFYVETSNVKV